MHACLMHDDVMRFFLLYIDDDYYSNEFQIVMSMSSTAKHSNRCSYRTQALVGLGK